MSHNNPFIHGNPVSPEQFIGRDTEVRRIVGRILTGQSTAITGSPRSGKTSILQYLIAPEKKTILYGDDEAEQLIFSYVDAGTLESEIGLTQFWAIVLKPFKKLLLTKHANSALSQTFQAFEKNGFLQEDEFEELVAKIQQIGWRFVVLLDEFEFLLHHPNLNSVKFFGTLRKRFSLSKGAFVLVTTASISRQQLNQNTQELNPTGSPYFNFIEEVILGTLSNTQIDELLYRNNDDFTKDDRRFIKSIARGHPYHLQLAASILWEIYEVSDEDDPLKRQKRVKQRFYEEIKKQSLINTVLRHLKRYQLFLKSIDFGIFFDIDKVENSKFYRIIAVVSVVLGIVAAILAFV